MRPVEQVLHCIGGVRPVRSCRQSAESHPTTTVWVYRRRLIRPGIYGGFSGDEISRAVTGLSRRRGPAPTASSGLTHGKSRAGCRSVRPSVVCTAIREDRGWHAACHC